MTIFLDFPSFGTILFPSIDIHEDVTPPPVASVALANGSRDT